MENISLNYFDVIVGVIVLLLGIKGFMNGSIKEIFGLGGLVAGVYFASRFAEPVADFIGNNFYQTGNTALLKLVGFLVVLILIWLLSTIIGSVLSKLASSSGLGFINRFLGFLVGGGKYFVIFAIIVTALSNVSLLKDFMDKQSKNSILYPYLKKTGSYLINLDPSRAEKTKEKKETAKEEKIKQEVNAKPALH